MFAGQEKGIGSEAVYVASNAYWEELTVTRPTLPESMCWEQAVDTWEAGQEIRQMEGNQFTIGPRSVRVFVGR
mgnify:CR=1 FL=1